MRVFAFSWRHESNSFARRLTPLGDFLRDGALPRGKDTLRRMAGSNTEWGGLIDAAERHGWTLTPSIAAITTPSGPLSAEAMETMIAAVLEDLAQAGSVDAVFAILHGAMQSALSDDGEGWVLARLREAVGPAIPIAVTLDPHANLTPAMIDAADLLVPYRTTPHVDQADTGRRCADLLAEMLARGRRPRHIWRQPPQNDLDDGRTNTPDAPMARLLRQADAAAAADPGIAAIGLFGGFPWGDIKTCGPSVLVSIWNDDVASAESLARGLAEQMWAARAESTLPFFAVDDGLAHAGTLPAAKGPIIFVDYADCPAGGSPGDNVELLKAFLRQGQDGFVYGICDDAAVAALAHKAGVGATITFDLGGRKDDRFSGRPLAATGRVLRVGDGRYTRTGPVGTGSEGEMGPTALLDVGGVRVAVASRPTPIEDQAQLRHFGIEPAAEERMLLKAMNHFRADFDAVAAHYIYIESPSLCSHDWSLFGYARIRRPVYPLDPDLALEDSGLALHVSPGRS